jgi:hypothetical protein
VRAIPSGALWRPSGTIASMVLAASSRGCPVIRISMSSWNAVEAGPGAAY